MDPGSPPANHRLSTSREPMDAGAAVDEPEEIQARVLNATLAEIKTARQSSADPDESRDCCVICLDAISDPCAAVPCGHAHFDFLCLVSWLREHPKCPLCKADVDRVRYADDQRAEAFYRVPNAPRGRHDAGGARNGTGSSHDATIRSRRFAAQNRPLRERERQPPRPPPTEDEAIRRRRYIYRHQLYSLRSNRISRYRPHPTPAQFASTPHLVSRARLWIRRELQVFSFLSHSSPSPSPSSNGDDDDDDSCPAATASREDRRRRRRNNAEFLLEYIVAILKTVDIQGSAGQAEAMLADFLGRAHARLFLHELRSWLRSPAPGLAAWDREVQYPEPAARRAPPDVVSRGESESESESPVAGDDDDDDDDDGEDERGTWWRDRGGDHWVAHASRLRGKKRKRRPSGGSREERAGRARGDTRGDG
ncbi:hypothetical protein VTH06DRAFT_8314 [Thermothelomyces fergusii]